MISIFRKHQQGMMIAITILVILSFVVFYNRTNFSERGGVDVVARVYERNISKHDVGKMQRSLQLAAQLGLDEMMQFLMGFERQYAVQNLIVLRHEADALGIATNNEEIAAAIQQLPVFATNGAFDPAKYGKFVDELLPPNGFTAKDLDEIVADNLRLKKLKELIDSSVTISPSEVREAYALENGKVQLSVVRFKLADFAATVQVADDDVKKRFEQQKENLKSEEMRSVKFVDFTMSDEEKKLTGKERAAVLEKLKTKAEEFAQAMTAKDAKFDDVAKKLGVDVKTTKPFSKAEPDPQIAKSGAMLAEVFKRTKEDPNSDPVRTSDGFAVFQLVEVIPSRPLIFDEAKPRLVEQIKNERAQELMTTRASEVRKKIEAETKAGKSFAEAASAAGVKAEQLAPFSDAEPDKNVPDARQLLFRAINLNEGELSEFVPETEGGVLVRLEKRLPIDEAAFEKEKPKLTEMMLTQQRGAAFVEWLRTRREAAKFQYFQG